MLVFSSRETQLSTKEHFLRTKIFNIKTDF